VFTARYGTVLLNVRKLIFVFKDLIKHAFQTTLEREFQCFKQIVWLSIPLGRPRRRWVDNIRMDLQEVGCGYMDWIGRAQYRDRWRTLVSAVMNLRVP